jgi:type II secretory pathway component PulK
MTAVRRRPQARGAALIAAVLVAAVIAAIAVALTTRDQYSILGVTRLQENSRAATLVRAVEVQAVIALSQDLENSRHDGEEEPWFGARFDASEGDLEAQARLFDAQRLFNLNALAFQPPADDGAADDGRGGNDVPPPVDEPVSEDSGADDAAARRALSDLAPELRDAVVPGTPGDTGDTPGAEGDQQKALSPQQIAVARFHLLLQALGLPVELVPPILDWLDTDSDTRFPNGAEDEYYTRLDEPYRAANGRFADISELRLIRGMTPEIYAKLAPFVTVLDNVVPLNVNTAPAELLMSIGPGVDRATAELLVSSRQVQPLTDVTEWLRHPLLAGRPLLQAGLATRSNWFELRTRIESDEMPTFHRSLIERSSPDRLRVARRERLYTDG